VQAADVPEIVSQTIKGKKVVDRLLYEDPVSGRKGGHESDIPFYKTRNAPFFAATSNRLQKHR
jgi:hypothetical protein